jgi:hypothetical protein
MEVLGLFLVAILIVGAGVLVLYMGIEENKKRLAAAEERQKNSIEWLRNERDKARLQNDIAMIKEQAELRPLVLETKRNILQGKADKRLLDAVFTRKALDEVLGAGSQAPEADPIEATAARILEEIESRKADGQDTAELDAALRTLRGMKATAT